MQITTCVKNNQTHEGISMCLGHQQHHHHYHPSNIKCDNIFKYLTKTFIVHRLHHHKHKCIIITNNNDKNMLQKCNNITFKGVEKTKHKNDF